jgi:hypothetical protein
MRAFFLGVLICFCGVTAWGDTTKAKCAAIAGPLSQTGQAFSQMYVALSGIDYHKVGAEFSLKEREQFEKLNEIHGRLLPVFEEYLIELENLGLMMNRCSR